MMKHAFKPLIAKSRCEKDLKDPPTIEDHCLAVRDAAEAIWHSIERDFAQSLAVNAEKLRDQVRHLLLAASVLHDIAKSNSTFQSMVYRIAKGKYQPVRHEVLAAALLTSERFWGQWFSEALPDKRSRWAVAWAVGGHHLQMHIRPAEKRTGAEKNEHQLYPLYRSSNLPNFLEVYSDHPQVTSLLKHAQAYFPCVPADVPRLKLQPFDLVATDLEEIVEQFACRSQKEWEDLHQDIAFKRDVALLKALLIAADVAGSALVTKGREVASSVRDWLRVGLSSDDAKAIYEENLDGRDAHDFQLRVANSKSLVTIVTAGCGNGKTTAAYMWAERQANGRKLFFAYPTTGTASSGYKAYLFAQTGLARRLMHSRAEVDLEAMWRSAEQEESPAESEYRIDSLTAWGQQVVACTADTILGLMQNQRRPLFSFPAIARGAFVFDEVHSYDRRLFGQLLRFLKTFPGAPVLIMSASIPPNRLEALKSTLKDRIDLKESCIGGDSEIENVERYRLFRRVESECWEEVAKSLNAGHKILWVCNRVDDAINVFREATRRFAEVLAMETMLYHSRYRYRDRVVCQDKVLREFEYSDKWKTVRCRPGPALVVTSQVCEVSLDISADLLLSPTCPLPAFIQRLGRLNRYAVSDNPKRALMYDFRGFPYDSHNEAEKQKWELQMKATENLIADESGRPTSQAKLSRYIDSLHLDEDWDQSSAWIDGGWETEQRAVREGDHSITVVREEDVERIGPRPRARDVVPWTIPMTLNRRLPWEMWFAGYCLGGYPVACRGSVDYSEYKYSSDPQLEVWGTGASWEKRLSASQE